MRYLTALLAACLSVVSFAYDVPCLDPLACNFLEEGECFFTDGNGDPCVIEGCTIEGACNYDPEADIYDGSCEFESCVGCMDYGDCTYLPIYIYDDDEACSGESCAGCLDTNACNFDPYAIWEDGTCAEFDSLGICGGDCFDGDYDANGICDSDDVGGCTNETATNYMPDATTNDGTCLWNLPVSLLIPQVIEGSPLPFTYDSQNITCIIHYEYHFSSCGVPSITYSQELYYEGSTDGGVEWSTDFFYVEGGGFEYYFEIIDTAGSFVFGLEEATDQCPVNEESILENGTHPYVASWVPYSWGGEGEFWSCLNDWTYSQASSGLNHCLGSCGATCLEGCTDPEADNFELGAGIDNGSCLYLGCTDDLADNYDAGANVEDGSCLYSGCMDSEADTYNPLANTGDQEVLCEYEGCTDPVADNYDAGANVEDGSCLYSGCMDTEADNYDAQANTGDQESLCEYEGCINPNSDNYDPEANVDDGSCVTPGCMYAAAINFDPLATYDNYSCEFLTPCNYCGEGTYWDDLAQACLTIETCQEDLDGDGVIGVNDLLELLSSFGTECAPEPEQAGWTCGDAMNYYGYDYATVQIGEQCWFAENLRTEHFTNGDAISANVSDSEWSSTTSGAVAVYGEDSGCDMYSPDGDACDPVWSLNEYGRLYNWYAVDDERGLCPTGWHVPTDGEWTVMTDFLGGDSVAVVEMKTTYGWYLEGYGTNSSGFSGLPGGYRGNYGSFHSAGAAGDWWSSSTSGNSGWYRALSYSVPYVIRNISVTARNGFSIRCLKDSE